MRRFLYNASFLLATVALSGCGGAETEPPPDSTDLGIPGGFNVSLESDGRLVIASEDGRVLLDGLPPGKVAADGPPLVGFAVRDVSLSYEMQFGSFKPD